MLKKVIPLTEAELPQPFAKYWRSSNRLKRKYFFYLVGGELYIREHDEPYLLHHWTLDPCCGIACFMWDLGIKPARSQPYVGLDGQYMFEVVQSDDYETSIRDPNGKLHVVHSG